MPAEPNGADHIRPQPSFAVVFRTYAWDAFIERQVARYAAIARGGTFFISVDETRGPLRPPGAHRIFSTTDPELIALGLPNRFAKGSLIWWNNDYPQYAFHLKHPAYDYYAFVEYDSLVREDLAPLIARIAAAHIDFAAQPIAAPLSAWFWWLHTRQAYGADEIRASLNCVSIFSRRAMHLLLSRRLEMAQDKRLKHWPISEAFVATEIARAGYSFAPLSDFGDTTGYDTAPPMREQDLGKLKTETFVHPVLDDARYVASVLRQGRSTWDYFDPNSLLRRKLARCDRSVRTPVLAGAAWRRFRTERLERLERSWLRIKLAILRYEELYQRLIRP